MPKEQYMCQLCANHAIFNQPKKGHKQKCPYRNCPCSLCALNTKRRALDQIERQLKHTNEPITAHAPTSMTSPSKECQLSPTIPKLMPNNPTAGKDTYRNSISHNNNAFTIQLPATITKKELKLLRRDEQPLHNSLKRSFPKNIEDEMETIKKEKISIFHSAEMLAIGESNN
ncbi:CBN-MAB-23 protein [Caenorhabditis brenneri]|uniref:CBN-MAB-23 protein n=1 Tax=Caenorhabditis brenneri TaxID=135651 RepID=G0N8Q6_CAEBE|nr:CBN-MAB-23 protein [Caenorhabditis brenneri]